MAAGRLRSCFHTAIICCITCLASVDDLSNAASHDAVQEVDACPDKLHEAKGDSFNLIQSAKIQVELQSFSGDESSTPSNDSRVPQRDAPLASPDKDSALLSKARIHGIISSLTFSHVARSATKLVDEPLDPFLIGLLVLFAILCLSSLLYACIAVTYKDSDNQGQHYVRQPPRESLTSPSKANLAPHVSPIFSGRSAEHSTFATTARAPASPKFATAAQASAPPSLKSLTVPAEPSYSGNYGVAASGVGGTLSPICPSLVVSVCESRFVIQMSKIHDVTEGEGTLTICGGVSGNALLNAYVCDGTSGRQVQVSTPESGAMPRVTIKPSESPEHLGNKSFLEICGLGGAYYGLLEIHMDGPCIVTRQGKRLMLIDGDPNELELWITAIGGNQIAHARCAQAETFSRKYDGIGPDIQEPFSGGDHIDITVQPGVDTVLILTLILAVLLFAPSG